MPRVQNDSGFLFCTNGRTHISGYSRAKARIEAAMQEEAAGQDIPHWTPHDLRRTVVTRMNEKLRVRPEVVEAAVNHVSGEAKRGIAGVYNRALYLPERQSAFEAWGRYVLAVVNDRQPENVVNLHG
jgi:integrase